MSLQNRFKKNIQLITAVFLIALSPAGALTHKVVNSDTLYGLSRRYKVPLNWIIRANDLNDETIRPGQALEIPLDGISSLEVRPGDTLSALALEFGISQEDLRRFNSMESSNLGIGQKLKIPPPVPEGTHRVNAGDTLLGIAIRYGLSTEQVRMYNSLNDDIIHPGQILTITAPRPEGHRVGNGESLWTIAGRYDLTMNDLKKWNLLGGDVIHPGEILALYPGLNGKEISIAETQISLASISDKKPLLAEKTLSESDIPENGEYFFSFPKKNIQPDDSYWESADASSREDFNRAGQVLDLFRIEIESLPALSSVLKGWHIVIDPGHGGLDPGAIVSVADGNGIPVVITEDEYAYDISMRLYRALFRNGASVSLTTLSPDHHVRNGIDARDTFVHRKNEVYNDSNHNEGRGWRPVGTIDGLDLRKTIAAREIRETPISSRANGILFISIHADNTPDLPAGTAVLFDGESDSEIESSRRLASTMAAHLGAGSFIRRQPLRVLKNNPADAAVLVEARNINYARNAWALRSADLREQDALMIADGILDWAQNHR